MLHPQRMSPSTDRNAASWVLAERQEWADSAFGVFSNLPAAVALQQVFADFGMDLHAVGSVTEMV